jgi:hypothetical protein
VIDATGTHLTGDLWDGTKIEAMLDTTHGYAAKEIILKPGKGTNRQNIFKWQFSGFKDFGNGVDIATTANFESYHENTVVFSRKISVLQAQFTTPSDNELTCDWHKPGLMLSDCRASKRWAYVVKFDDLPANITSDQLLELAKKNAIVNDERLKKAQEANEAKERQDATRKKIRFSGIILFLITIAIVITVIIKNMFNKRKA